MKYQVMKSSRKFINHSENPLSQKIALSTVHIQENSSRVISPMERVSHYQEQTENLKLKRKVYTRENREEITR